MGLVLRQTTASGPLIPARLAQAFGVLARLPGAAPAPRGTMHGQELRLAVALRLDDPACAAFLLDFAGQGERVRGTARGPSEALLTWAFHALAAAMKCPLHDEDSPVTPLPESHREAALAYLADYESEVRRGAEDGAAFVRWLAREEQVILRGDGAALGAALPLEAPAALYEMLLDSDDIDEVFASEREITAFLARFLARSRPR